MNTTINSIIIIYIVMNTTINIIIIIYIVMNTTILQSLAICNVM